MNLRQSSPFRVFPLASLFFLLGMIGALVACGSSNMSMTSTRQLQSITVTPASASATSTNKTVQFTAMGNFNMNPMTAMMSQVMWTIGPPFSSMPAPAGVTIDSNGMAQCTTFVGTVNVEATAPMNPSMPMSQMSNMGQNVTGMAQLTCP